MHVVFSDMDHLVIRGRSSGTKANNSSLLNDKRIRVCNLHRYRRLRLHDLVCTLCLRRLGLLDVLHVVVFATYVKCLHVYIPLGCGGMSVLRGAILDVHPLDLCRVTRTALLVLHNDHVSVSCNIIASWLIY